MQVYKNIISMVCNCCLICWSANLCKETKLGICNQNNYSMLLENVCHWLTFCMVFEVSSTFLVSFNFRGKLFDWSPNY